MKKNVLLVEDNPATVDIIETELEFLGYNTMVADNGKRRWKWLRPTYLTSSSWIFPCPKWTVWRLLA